MNEASRSGEGDSSASQMLSLIQSLILREKVAGAHRGQVEELLPKRLDASTRIDASTQSGASAHFTTGEDGAPETLSDFADRFGIDSESLLSWLKHTESLCLQSAKAGESIAYLGPIYSYSYLAACKHFGLASELVPVSDIAAAFEEVDRGHATYGVVPIENSTDGRVVDTLGMFARSPAKICGEVLLPIHHCLLGRGSRSEIREVRSKPQALSQCRNWLSNHLPDAKLVEVSSTAAAAREASETAGIAAIASYEAGVHHGLSVIEKNIEDNQTNVTRFAIIGSSEPSPTGRDKTSLMFQLEHKPGALASAMTQFQTAGVNLTWIESFPLPNAPNEYLFFVELEGHRESGAVASAIANLERESPKLDVLGSYPKGLQPV